MKRKITRNNSRVLTKAVQMIIVASLLIACNDDDSDEPEPLDFGQRNLMTLERFYDGLEQEDETIFNLLAENVTDNVRLNPDGSQNPITFSGIEEVRGFITSIFQSFDNISFKDRRYTVSEDGTTIFIQTIGVDWIFAPTGGSYENVYIFRIDFNSEGQIQAIEEYLNWVVNSEVTGTPLGSCGEIICR